MNQTKGYMKAIKNSYPYEKRIKVMCSKCGWINEKDVEFVNIEEDFQGADILTFICPMCGQKRKSHRVG